MCIMAETVEAIQCKLGDIYILWPGTPENPPKYINDEDIYYENPPRFDKPNELGPVFEYEPHQQTRRWYLKRENKDAT